MKIYIGTDHAGFELKEELKIFLESLGCMKLRTRGLTNLMSLMIIRTLFTQLLKPWLKILPEDLDSRGIVIGGSGQGEAIVANKVKGIRAAVIYDEYSAEMSRKHNDANILSLGNRTLTICKAKKLVHLWMETPFSNEERHKRRIEKIKAIENNTLNMS